MRLSYDLKTLTGDIAGAVASTVIVLPWALAAGVASGLGPLAGLYGAIAIGFFAAVFGGTRAQISDTSAPMLVAMTVVLTQYADDLAQAFTIVMLAGLIQVALGALSVGRFVSHTPYSVIAGIMAGIGIVLMIGQVSPLLGANATMGGGLVETVLAWPGAFAALDANAAVVGAVTLVVCIWWPPRIGRFLPAYLVALVVGTAVAFVLPGDAPTIGALPTGLPTLQAPTLSPDFLAGAVQPALILAFIGSVSSLLSSQIHDSLTLTRHKPGRELVGQGLGNVVAGLLGTLPGSASLVTTVANIRAGARTPVSGALRSIVLLALVLGGGGITEAIPIAALAAIMMKAGWDIVDWHFLSRIPHISRDYVMVILVTLALAVFIDLVTAVAVGLVVSVLTRASEVGRVELDNVVSVPLLDRAFFLDEEGDAGADPFSARVGFVDLRGYFSMASANELLWAVSADIQDHEVVILDFSNTVYMDDSAARVMEKLVDAAKAKDTECIVKDLSGPVERALASFDVFRRLPKDRFVAGRDEARALAKRLLAERDRKGGSRV